MQDMDWLKKITLWGFHIIVWILLNIILGSLPFFVTLFRNGEEDPFLIGLLCFCFTTASSGLYIFVVNSQQGEHSGFAKAIYMFLISVTVVWIVSVWTIVLMLPAFLQLIGSDNKLFSSVFLYIFSVFLLFFANYKSLSDLVNNHVSKCSIAGPVLNSKVSGSEMKDSLGKEDSF